MGLLRRNKDDGGGEAPPAGAYLMREKAFAIGDDYWIENGAGQRVFKVNGKAMRMRKTLRFEDTNGRELLHIQERKLSVRDKMVIERDGNKIATVKKALVGIRDRFEVEVEGGSEFKVKGNFIDHEYTFKHDDREVATVSKKWFRARDTYGVEIAPDQNDILILAATVCIEQMSHEGVVD